MDSRVYIGIDTSNYTTSIAVIGADGQLIANLKRLLPVADGECGLRQSDALFAHIKNIPHLTEELRACMSDKTPVAIGVSTRPRNVEGSYMPVFLAGVAVAESLAAAFNIPLYKFSHQCGHIMAALYSSDRMDLADKEFAAFHVSGGTTELVRVSPDESGFITDIVGGTLDLNAGQVIDRIGVSMGMPFPAGAHLERMALGYSGKIEKKRISGDGLHVNLSGLENMAKKMYSDTADKSKVAAFVFDHVSRAIITMADAYKEKYGECPLVCAGGVMCNSVIKSKIKERHDAYFAEPALSSDNAVGIANLARRAHLKENV